ncbi:protein MpDIR19 [Marchantia polymorpha subsp. ruderalis]|uniref:Dirigent protein n=2 Tax=Marchantia polymorpha TaxID=3197 RepID=A0AAF6BRE0_MARPO|nr:hypothetical protein MARPO_0059s0072 [Marchantia polymorpha]BBN14574.1 hypothetical protein Mp_6g12750 [Marchantia polymorpha subsp. ruderalis]|eukprot:PTQ37145.1 hypothetical protein MARPO_0059s0072 [Marchantia polymorpha]
MDRTHGTSTLAVFLSALCILSSGWLSPASAMDFKAVKFTYYLHDSFVPPNVTVVVVAGANATLTGVPTLGDISVFDSILKETASNASAQIGHSSGELVSLSDPAQNFITFVQEITILGYSGTISASARFNFTALSWEVGVSSGTGSFRGAMGYFRVTIVSLDPSFPVIKYEANLILPRH